MLDKIDTKLLRLAGFRAYKLLLESKPQIQRLDELAQDKSMEMTGRAAYVSAFIPPGYPTTEDLIDKLVQALPAAGIIQAHFCPRWVSCGAPAIKMGHTYAAALMATDVPEDKSQIKPPWPFFYIEVPNDLLKSWDTISNQWVDVVGITVSHYQSKRTNSMVWAYSTLCTSGVSLYRFGTTVDDLVVHPNHLPPGDKLSDLILTEVDARTQELIGRLILNTCLAFDHSGTVKPPRKGLRVPQAADLEAPPLAVFNIGRTLNVDCRDSVRSYITSSTNSKLPSVVTLVRGHWKNQRYGEKRSSLKRIWIEPYYRGPEHGIMAKLSDSP